MHRVSWSLGEWRLHFTERASLFHSYLPIEEIREGDRELPQLYLPPRADQEPDIQEKIGKQNENQFLPHVTSPSPDPELLKRAEGVLYPPPLPVHLGKDYGIIKIHLPPHEEGNNLAVFLPQDNEISSTPISHAEKSSISNSAKTHIHILQHSLVLLVHLDLGRYDEVQAQLQEVSNHFVHCELLVREDHDEPQLVLLQLLHDYLHHRLETFSYVLHGHWDHVQEAPRPPQEEDRGLNQSPRRPLSWLYPISSFRIFPYHKKSKYLSMYL
ncbi:uncharacterised protein [Saccharolobus solfataricus]|uniref:Uncharacterized protein n=1 Tax=Saccharolobus solfataricus TaxID=2287 RepID=A0A157T1W5_SACSO|nr:uncharacterised protein [Saccharolobus solfataricus]